MRLIECAFRLACGKAWNSLTNNSIYGNKPFSFSGPFCCTEKSITSTMLSIDYKQPMSRVRWNLWNQTVLCCMFRFFHKDKEVFSRVFESLFSGDLQAFDHELPYGTLNTQWCDLRRHGDPVWQRVHICIAFPASGPWLQLLSSIKERAISLGFSLVEKQIDDIDTSIFRLNPARRRNRRDLPSDTYDSTPASTQSSSSLSWQVLSGQPGPPEVSDETDAASPAPPCTPEEEFCLESNVSGCLISFICGICNR